MKQLTKNQIAMCNARTWDNAESVRPFEDECLIRFDFSAYEKRLGAIFYEKLLCPLNKHERKNIITNAAFGNMQGFCIGKFGRDFYI